jgi:Xaa-Pro aminopeptidase|tara:strand:+ start:1773 stop:3089 length:1317 start_codon:yes stop_codon:yes gene_type:complete
MLGFSPNLFWERRKTVFSKLDETVLVLTSGSIRNKSRDTEIPFRPDSDFFYLTGVCEPDSVAVLRPNGSDGDLILFIPSRDLDKERWTGQRMGLEGFKEEYGAVAVYGRHQLEEYFPSLITNTDKIHFRIGSDQRVQDLIFASLKATRLYKPRGEKGLQGVLDPGCILDEMRLFKDDEELDRIRRATQITSESFCEMLKYCSPGTGEWELAAALEFGFRKRGASGTAYPTIVGSGSNSCVLHYSDNSRRMEAGDLVLVDGGAEVDLYAGDITRTFPVSGSFTPPQKAVYEVVQRAHRSAINEVAPGAVLDSIHRVAVSQLVEGLLDLGVLEGSAEEIIDKRAYKKFFPHQTSHWLGLDVHDVGDYFVGDQSRTLQPGMVLTVEPGLYFPRLTEDVEEFCGIGIRIEDDVVVTEEGSELLGLSLPVSTGDVESLLEDQK